MVHTFKPSPPWIGRVLGMACLFGGVGCATGTVLPSGNTTLEHAHAGTPEVDPGPQSAAQALDPATDLREPSSGDPVNHAEPLDWASALHATLAEHPLRMAGEEEAQALQWERRIAGFQPNPTVGLDVEDFAGQGAFSGFDGAQSTLWYSQTIERGGKRAARERVAEAEGTLHAIDQVLLRQRLVARTRAAFLQALAAQEALQWALQREQSVRSFHEAVVGRVQAGKATPLDQTQYSILLATVRLEAQNAHQEDRAAKLELARCCGLRGSIDQVQGPWPDPTPLDSAAQYLERLEQSEIWLRNRESHRVAEAAAAQAQADRKADWTWTFGVRRYESEDSLAGTVGVEFPWQRSPSTALAARASQARARQARFEARAQQRDLRAGLLERYAQVQAASERLQSLEGTLLEDAEWAAQAVDEGYRQGRFELLQVLDAQQTYFELRSAKARAEADYHQARAALEAWVGHLWE